MRFFSLFFLVFAASIFYGVDARASHTTVHIDDGFPGAESDGAWNLIVQETTATTATITWNTTEPSLTWLQYGTTIAFGHEYKDDIKKKEHKVSLANLEQGTTYFFTVFVEGSKSIRRYHRRMEGMKMINYYSSPSFVTLTRAQEQEAERKKAEAMMSGKAQLIFKFYGDAIEQGHIFSPIFKDTERFDLSAPRIISLSINSDSSAATLSWMTDYAMTEGYVGYGRDDSYGFWKYVSCTENCTSHTTTLDGLTPGSEIHFKIRMRGKYNEDKMTVGYSIVETPDLSFIVPSLPGQKVTIPLRQADFTAPEVADIRVTKIAGDSRRAYQSQWTTMNTSYYEIPKRVEISLATDEPSSASLELLHIKADNYNLGVIEKAEIISSPDMKKKTTLFFEPLIDADRDYAYQITVRDLAGNQQTTRFFALNARGARYDNGATMTAPQSYQPAVSSGPVFALPQSQQVPRASSAAQPLVKKQHVKKELPQPSVVSKKYTKKKDTRISKKKDSSKQKKNENKKSTGKR